MSEVRLTGTMVKQWIAHCRDPKIKQGFYVAKSNDCYCALGVLKYFVLGGKVVYNVTNLIRFQGITLFKYLVFLNDGKHLTLPQIADVLEAELLPGLTD